MYLVQKAGHYLHEAIGLYERLDVAIAFAAEAIGKERDTYHQYKIYSIVPEKAVEYLYPCCIVSCMENGKIYVDKFVGYELQSSTVYVKEEL